VAAARGRATRVTRLLIEHLCHTCAASPRSGERARSERWRAPDLRRRPRSAQARAVRPQIFRPCPDRGPARGAPRLRWPG